MVYKKIIFYAKVMLTTNLCVPFGLFNGATGTIIDLIYKNENQPENSLPDVVMVQLDNYSGLPFIKEHSKIVPIVPVKRKIDCNCCGCRRTQIPLMSGDDNWQRGSIFLYHH